MTILIGGQHGVVYFGPRDNHEAVRWWAERGQLHWEDSRTNGYGTVSIKEFLLRLRGISDMLSNGKSKANEGIMHADEVERHMKFIEEAVELVRKAKEQGDPSDVRVQKHAAQNRPVTMVMPSSISAGKGVAF